MVDEEEDRDDERLQRERKARSERQEGEERKRRRTELETRIGMTKTGYDWLNRVDQIGKDGPIKGE